jgi:hypothetical protein
MPPKTADAADAFKSVRREKLIGFSLEGYCSCDDPMSPVIRILARLLQRPHATATEGFGGSGLLGLKAGPHRRQAGLVCQKIRLNI